MLNDSKGVVSFNNTLISKSEFKLNLSNKGTIVYEVIRLYNGVPMFFDDHCDRLQSSLFIDASGFKPNKLQIENSILALIQKNNLVNTNLRIDVYDKNVLIYEIAANYPSPKDYLQGVDVVLDSIERKDPNEKIYRDQWKKEVEQKILDAGVFELVLVNKHGLITEGSRSNVFFIRDNKLFSAEESLILPGVTRFEILKIARNLGVPLEYIELEKETLVNYDAAFLCGTSIHILPIAKINKLSFSVDNALLLKLQKMFEAHYEQEYNTSKIRWKR